ncbi:MAG: HlyD family secretion protein [Chitinispirillaceae bacterium]
MRKLILIWVLIVVVLVTMTLTLNREVSVFQGIADAREITINNENAVEISRIKVVAGQTVSKGDHLLQLHRPELEMRITELTHSLERIKAQAYADVGSINSQIRQLEAERASTLNRYNSQIEELQARQKLNRELASELKSVNTGQIPKDDHNITRLRISNLKKDLAFALDAIDLRIRLLRNSSDQPVEVQIRSMEEELEILQEEKRKLRVVSPIDGVIGSVNFKEGEKVSPFAPVLTLHTRSPSYIKGFVYEDIFKKVSIGQMVRVTSMADRKSSIEGEVVGIGSRIVLFPERLWKRPDVRLWGIEVQIKIPEHNEFLLGEKVSITPVGPIRKTLFGRLTSFFPPSSHASQPAFSKPAQFYNLKSNLSTTPLEASGVVYFEDIDRYCVISDDTDKDQAILFITDSAGSVTEEVVISGAGKISDMESICTDDDDTLYIAASQSYSKKGNLPDKRKVLLKVVRKGLSFKIKGKVLLHDRFNRWRKTYPEQKAAEFLNHAFQSRTADIEGMFFFENHLCFGFKNPLFDSARSVILSIPPDQLFSDESLKEKSVSVWDTLPLEYAGERHHISDLFYEGHALLVASVNENKEKRVGCVWKYENSRLSLIRSFQSMKPEGVCADSRENIAVVFDNGNKRDSKFTLFDPGKTKPVAEN